ncbi:aldehyde-activating protein [Primorskyibacter flagellatus]|uniref:Aldehyde-activating protein n=1 Tax=Primorskyibacter flagellatus TaxID=1387277 RepID=A0A917AEI1_9RHOB|nr:GFA family protein [Primorskyibacter flagellatus]GGE47126.1 aldehyde-activating protein [Primorskyibacter flagellatus]
MPVATCHCGAVTLDLTAPPSEVTECNCSICRRYGVLWAYMPPAEVTIRTTGPTDRYVREGGDQAFQRCATCGCVTHWQKFDPAFDRMGVNARLLPPDILAAARLRHLDGAETDRYLD